MRPCKLEGKDKGENMGEILKRSHSLLEAVPATFLFTDVHSRILYANCQTENFFGYSCDEMEGKRIRTLFLDEDLIHFLPNIIYLTRYKDGFDGEALLRRKDGTKIFVHLFTTAFTEGGETFLSFGFQEIQRLKLLEREKLEAERWASLGRMVEEIAHQFRNPLSSVGGYAQRILKGSLASPKAKTYLENVRRAAGRMETVLARVEELVRVPRPSFQRDRIEAIVNASLDVLSPKAAEQGITLRVNRRQFKGDGTFFADRNLLIRTLDQILENSCEAISRKPLRERKKVVDLQVLDDGENVGMAVTDWGEGIPKKNLGLIFDPFFTTRTERVGLGLTFVWRVIEEHGGAVRVNSIVNRGTTITMTFPKDRRRKVRREWLAPEAAALRNA
jgi:PAS domain S-box-containing protein